MGPTLLKYVDGSLLSKLGFDDDGFDSYNFSLDDIKRPAFAYLGQIYTFLSKKEEYINFVVIGVGRKNYFNFSEKRDKHLDWYFGMIKGPHTGQCKNENEAKEFLSKVKDIVHRRNRIPIKKLEGIFKFELQKVSILNENTPTP